MPLYRYRCQKCESDFSVFHRIKETQDTCQKCDHKGALTKLVTRPLKRKRGLKTTQVGDITKEHIKTNQEILEKEKKKAKEETYESS